nr:unnamed protein product [Callosobruchus analis]
MKVFKNSPSIPVKSPGALTTSVGLRGKICWSEFENFTGTNNRKSYLNVTSSILREITSIVGVGSFSSDDTEGDITVQSLWQEIVSPFIPASQEQWEQVSNEYEKKWQYLIAWEH